MKQILNILIFTLITFAYGARKDTLSGSFLHVKRLGARPEIFGNPEIAEMLSKIDFDCIKDKLQMDKFGSKFINEIEQDILYKQAAIACHEDVLSELISFKGDGRAGKFDLESNPEAVNCFKAKLFELEPTSKLITEADQESIKACKSNFIYLVPNKMRNEFVNYNAAVNDLTCGKVTQNDFTALFVKGFIVELSDLDEDLKKSEAKEIKEKEKLFTKHAFDCIIKKFEDEDVNEV